MRLILAAAQLSSGDKRPENNKLTGTQTLTSVIMVRCSLPVELSGQLGACRYVG